MDFVCACLGYFWLIHLTCEQAWYMQFEYFRVRMVEPLKDIGWEH